MLIALVGAVWFMSDTHYAGIPRKSEAEGLFFVLFGIFAVVGIFLHFAFQMVLWMLGFEALDEDVFDDRPHDEM